MQPDQRMANDVLALGRANDHTGELAVVDAVFLVTETVGFDQKLETLIFVESFKDVDDVGREVKVEMSVLGRDAGGHWKGVKAKVSRPKLQRKATIDGVDLLLLILRPCPSTAGLKRVLRSWHVRVQ